ncbi:MAG: aminoglycoside phosphotransferase family protein [Chloroflexota bacterium]
MANGKFLMVSECGSSTCLHSPFTVHYSLFTILNLSMTDAPILLEALLQSLLLEAGIKQKVDRILLLGSSTNTVWKVEIGAHQYVVRHRLDDNLNVAEKEFFLSKVLHEHDVPAVEVLAIVANHHGVATLSSWIPGISLEQAIHDYSTMDLGRAWFSAGAILRLSHGIEFPVAGEIVGDRVEPFESVWGQWVLEGVVDDIRWLQNKLQLFQIDFRLLERVVSKAQVALENRPNRLVHNDALPQNILVHPGKNGWECTGWVDWEFARSGDPMWDLATLDFRPANLVPTAFYDGYGHHPAEPISSIYELLMGTWRIRVELEHGALWEWPPQKERLRYARDLPNQIEKLASML